MFVVEYGTVLQLHSINHNRLQENRVGFRQCSASEGSETFLGPSDLDPIWFLPDPSVFSTTNTFFSIFKYRYLRYRNLTEKIINTLTCLDLNMKYMVLYMLKIFKTSALQTFWKQVRIRIRKTLLLNSDSVPKYASDPEHWFSLSLFGSATS